VIAAAAKPNLPVAGFDATVAGNELRPGDRAVALVDQIAGQHHRQWLVVLAPRALSAEEQLRPPPKEVRMHVSTGHAYSYDGQNAAIAIRCLGPYLVDADEATAAVRAKDLQAGALVNSTFLGLGLDESCRMSLRMEEASRLVAQREHRSVNFTLSAGATPFPRVTAAGELRTKEAFIPTESEERAFAGSFLALVGFVEVGMRTPGLNEVLFSVTDIPWLSLVSHIAQLPQINIAYRAPVRQLVPEDWGLPTGTPLYAQPFVLEVNGKPALLCQIAVMSPRPPFRTSAGIVGIAAQRPDGTGAQLSIRLLAARLAPETATPTPAPAN